jgi:hypothetical protein
VIFVESPSVRLVGFAEIVAVGAGGGVVVRFPPPTQAAMKAATTKSIAKLRFLFIDSPCQWMAG